MTKFNTVFLIEDMEKLVPCNMVASADFENYCSAFKTVSNTPGFKFSMNFVKSGDRNINLFYVGNVKQKTKSQSALFQMIEIKCNDCHRRIK